MNNLHPQDIILLDTIKHFCETGVPKLRSFLKYKSYILELEMEEDFRKEYIVILDIAIKNRLKIAVKRCKENGLIETKKSKLKSVNNEIVFKEVV